MDPVAIGLTAFKVGSSLLGGMSSDDAAQNAAQAQIEAMQPQRREQRRQMLRAARREYGAGRAAIGASNIQFSGSAENYLRELNMENMREIAFHRQTQRLDERAIREGAQGVGDAYKWQAAGDVLGYAARAFAGSLYQSDPTPYWGAGGTASDPFLNRAEAGGAFDELF